MSLRPKGLWETTQCVALGRKRKLYIAHKSSPDCLYIWCCVGFRAGRFIVPMSYVTKKIPKRTSYTQVWQEATLQNAIKMCQKLVWYLWICKRTYRIWRIASSANARSNLKFCMFSITELLEQNSPSRNYQSRHQNLIEFPFCPARLLSWENTKCLILLLLPGKAVRGLNQKQTALCFSEQISRVM